ncbi:unnamed protein product [Withania somnifera]
MISRRSCVQRLFTIDNCINHQRWSIRPLMAFHLPFLLDQKIPLYYLTSWGFGFYLPPLIHREMEENTFITMPRLSGFGRAQVFAPPHPLLLHDAEETTTSKPSHTDNNSSHRGSSAGFFNLDLQDKIVVAVDVDEVLGNFVSAVNEFVADRYSSYHSVSEYHVYEFFKIWKCSREEADIRVHEFFKTPYFKTGIRPIPAARQTLQKLSRFCNLSIVTSRQNAIKDHTIEWIERHYPGLFQDIHFGNHFALNGKSIAKSDICRSFGANVLIDDNPTHAIECAEVGIKSLNGHPMVKKVHNWGEVEHQLASWMVPRNSSSK